MEKNQQLEELQRQLERVQHELNALMEQEDVDFDSDDFEESAAYLSDKITEIMGQMHMLLENIDR